MQISIYTYEGDALGVFGNGLSWLGWVLICLLLRHVEKLASEPEKFGRTEALGEAIGYHVMGTNMLGDNLLCLEQPSNIMGFKGDVSGAAGYLG